MQFVRVIGVLIWVFDITQDNEYRLSLGMGKPLDMGAVKIKSQLYLSKRKARYTKLFNNFVMSSSSIPQQNYMNIQLVTTLVKIIRSLSQEERKLLEQELFFDDSEPSTQELINLAQTGGSFNFLYDEPDIYTLEDGEPV